MHKISDSIKAIVEKNSLIEFGLSNNLFNLSQLAKFMLPLVESRTKKEITISALLMGLSRYQKNMNKVVENVQRFHIKNLFIHSDLCAITYNKTPEIHKDIQKLYTHVLKLDKFITLTEGANEISIILENSMLSILEKQIEKQPRYKNTSISSIGMKFSESYVKTPGLIFTILQQVTLQGINIVEISSTLSELIIYIDQKDATLAFDTLYNCFSRQ